MLEIGCGNGDDAAYLAGVGHKALATDVSRSAIENAWRRRAGVPGLVFEEHDAAQPFDLPDASLDAVYARLPLHYFDDASTRRIVAELARILRPAALLAFMCKSTDDPLYGRGREIERDVYEADHIRHFFSEPYVRDVLADQFEAESITARSGVLYGSPSSWLEVTALRPKE